METCASAHHWGRAFGELGHDVRLIAPIYVKPFVKRQKNDAADAEAICEAALRPTVRFVAVKSEDKQSSAMVFKTRDLLARQKTRTINALRGHLFFRYPSDEDHGSVVLWISSSTAIGRRWPLHETTPEDQLAVSSSPNRRDGVHVLSLAQGIWRTPTAAAASRQSLQACVSFLF